AGDRERGARLAALDLAEHGRADAAALGQIAQREAHRLPERFDPRTYHTSVCYRIRPDDRPLPGGGGHARADGADANGMVPRLLPVTLLVIAACCAAPVAHARPVGGSESPDRLHGTPGGDTIHGRGGGDHVS